MRRTILLADDSATIQRIVTETFAGSDYDVVAVGNGDVAVQKIEEIRPHVILADIFMPGRNGYEVCAYVHSHASLSGTPVILLIGAFDAFDEDTARKASAAASITKPFEPQALVHLVRSVLARERQQPAPQQAKAEPETSVAVNSSVEAPAVVPPDSDDLLGLGPIFQPAPPPAVDDSKTVSDDQIERIVERVIQRLSPEVIESIAWNVVPDIAEKILREELKRLHES